MLVEKNKEEKIKKKTEKKARERRREEKREREKERERERKREKTKRERICDVLIRQSTVRLLAAAARVLELPAAVRAPKTGAVREDVY